MNSLLNGIRVGVASPAAQGPLWIDFFLVRILPISYLVGTRLLDRDD